MILGVKNLKYDNSYIHHNDKIFREKLFNRKYSEIKNSVKYSMLTVLKYLKKIKLLFPFLTLGSYFITLFNPHLHVYTN